MTMTARLAAVLGLVMLAAAPWANAQTASKGGGTRPADPMPATGADASQPHPTDRVGGAISGGLPRMSGITPSRAELPASAFTKLDARQRGYVTREDVQQLDGFDAAFRAGDQNGDGRLNPAEFNTAWGIYSGTTR